jgi:hypothetical protein
MSVETIAAGLFSALLPCQEFYPWPHDAAGVCRLSIVFGLEDDRVVELVDVPGH